MELIYQFVEDQLACAVKYRGDLRIVNGFKHNAYGAWVFYVYQRIRAGATAEEIDALDNEWDNKYRIHFEALENEAS
jgi:hypothetical protein